MTNKKSHMGLTPWHHWHHDRWPWMTLNCFNIKFSWNFVTFLVFRWQWELNEWR